MVSSRTLFADAALCAEEGEDEEEIGSSNFERPVSLYRYQMAHDPHFELNKPHFGLPISKPLLDKAEAVGVHLGGIIPIKDLPKYGVGPSTVQPRIPAVRADPKEQLNKSDSAFATVTSAPQANVVPLPAKRTDWKSRVSTNASAASDSRCPTSDFPILGAEPPEPEPTTTATGKNSKKTGGGSIWQKKPAKANDALLSAAEFTNAGKAIDQAPLCTNDEVSEGVAARKSESNESSGNCGSALVRNSQTDITLDDHRISSDAQQQQEHPSTVTSSKSEYEKEAAASAQTQQHAEPSSSGSPSLLNNSDAVVEESEPEPAAEARQHNGQEDEAKFLDEIHAELQKRIQLHAQQIYDQINERIGNFVAAGDQTSASLLYSERETVAKRIIKQRLPLLLQGARQTVLETSKINSGAVETSKTLIQRPNGINGPCGPTPSIPVPDGTSDGAFVPKSADQAGNLVTGDKIPSSSQFASQEEEQSRNTQNIQAAMNSMHHSMAADVASTCLSDERGSRCTTLANPLIGGQQAGRSQFNGKVVSAHSPVNDASTGNVESHNLPASNFSLPGSPRRSFLQQAEAWTNALEQEGQRIRAAFETDLATLNQRILVEQSTMQSAAIQMARQLDELKSAFELRCQELRIVQYRLKEATNETDRSVLQKKEHFLIQEIQQSRFRYEDRWRVCQQLISEQQKRLQHDAVIKRQELSNAYTESLKLLDVRALEAQRVLGRAYPEQACEAVNNLRPFHNMDSLRGNISDTINMSESRNQFDYPQHGAPKNIKMEYPLSSQNGANEDSSKIHETSRLLRTLNQQREMASVRSNAGGLDLLRSILPNAVITVAPPAPSTDFLSDVSNNEFSQLGFK